MKAEHLEYFLVFSMICPSTWSGSGERVEASGTFDDAPLDYTEQPCRTQIGS